MSFPPRNQSPEELEAELKRRLEWFIFFHLGSDAELEVEAGDGPSLRISVRHRRVQPFHLTLRETELRTLLEDPARLEALMLDQLTRYRR